MQKWFVMKIQTLIKKQRKFYKKIGSIYCPILDAKVSFSSEGFNHLLYHSYNRPRKLSEQFMKLKCLQYAPEVIKKCSLIAPARNIRKKKKGKWKKGIQYELVYSISKRKKIRVIVEKLGKGSHKFLSVMPHDRRSKH